MGSSFVSPTTRERSVRELLERREKGSQCLVATARDLLSPDAGSVVVGSVEYSTHEFQETSISPCLDPSVRKLYVTEMAVADPFRRRGIAMSLLTAIDEEAKALGITCVCLFVEMKNRAALSLYLKAGYKLVPYSDKASAFAAAIGLYKGPLANREYYFLYKSVPVPAPQTSAPAVQEWAKYRVAPRLAV